MLPRTLMLLCALLLCGCRDTPVADRGAKVPARPADQSYTVRGKIVELPAADQPRSELRIRHEAIDTFVNGEGKVSGMGAMEMEFPPASGVSLKGLAVGDVVELNFSVWWDRGAASWYATGIRKLPADTKLEFRAAKPPTPAGSPAP